MTLQSKGVSYGTMSVSVDEPASLAKKVEPVKWLKYVSSVLGNVVVLAIVVIIMTIYVMAVIINFVFWVVVIIVGTVFQLRKWLGWKHECASFWLLVTLKFRDAELYRAHTKQLDKYIAARGDARTVERIVQEVVQTQLDAVSALLEGATTFIQVKDTVTLSSVVVATLFYAAYLVHFGRHGFDIAAVNSKAHDALAIILPLLLQEELAVAMAQVLLWCRWTTTTFKGSPLGLILHDIYVTMATNFTGSVAQGQQVDQLVFDSNVGHQCFGVGIGAVDTTGVATFVTSLWTLLFLVQGYIVETLADTIEHADAAWMVTTYWALVIYSGCLIVFCYLPFFTKSSDQQKEDFESLAASCEAYLLLQHMSQLNDRVVDEFDKPSQMVHSIRIHALRLMDTDDIVAYSLYVLALSEYFFKPPNHGGSEAPTILQPIYPGPSYFWSNHWTGTNHSALPSILKPLPLEKATETQLLYDTMTLFTVPVMGIRPFQDVLTERKITDMAVLYDNPFVQEKKVYVARETKDVVCIGLEVKIMEHYTTSIYIMAEKGTQFGRGLVFVDAHPLQPVVKTPKIEFVQVADNHQLRVLAACTLDIDPTAIHLQEIVETIVT
ncbi:Aste57867_13453 [Aphanomyces stellatus]|uniref:Aste57867_13453 protein n=1 Tax=Aphanomyces stellatus TaxID=120398 RepID=A0A485KZ20_9STRA|nr:hypothetical protein As57867_013403 [Aphanomyces stellatus]VFT90291.1 Aste57867_13453 [Aphanomyces stellatus]